MTSFQTIEVMLVTTDPSTAPKYDASMRINRNTNQRYTHQTLSSQMCCFGQGSGRRADIRAVPAEPSWRRRELLPECERCYDTDICIDRPVGTKVFILDNRGKPNPKIPLTWSVKVTLLFVTTPACNEDQGSINIIGRAYQNLVLVQSSSTPGKSRKPQSH